MLSLVSTKLQCARPHVGHKHGLLLTVLRSSSRELLYAGRAKLSPRLSKQTVLPGLIPRSIRVLVFVEGAVGRGMVVSTLYRSA